MEDTTATRLIDKSDGTQSLLLRQVRLTVTKGPDRGAELLVDATRIRVGSDASCALQLTDPAVSREHFELRATDDGYLLRDLGSTNGTILAGARVREALLGHGVVLQVGSTSVRVAPTASTVEIPLSSRLSFGALLGQSRAMRQLFAILERVAPSESTVLIEGESGTGKELTAEAIHAASMRAEQPLVVVDCGSIPASLIESELFGHERGAFTGAEQARVGAFEQADGGTVFLDEIGELPLELQPRLLRFLETQQVKRVGSAQHRTVNVRVVAATNRNIKQEVEAKRFRTDLYYRLSVVRIELPALRERPEDVLLLAHHFAESLARDPRSVITDEVAALLSCYDWPGNARELRNVVERLVLFPDADPLHSGRPPGEVPTSARAETPAAPGPPRIGALVELAFHEARTRWQDAFERQYLTAQLERAGGVVLHAAKRAQLPRQTFHRLLKRHGLKEG